LKTSQKIVSVNALKRKIKDSRRGRKKIAFTNGCFDIIHLGHVRYLETAKKKNRVLIVGLNSDRSIKKIKGSKRPIVSQIQRASVLAALECVDYVTIFNEETPLKLITALKPDILIKGADWKNKGAVGADVVYANGGKVEFIKYIPKSSTTNIINTILKKCKKR